MPVGYSGAVLDERLKRLCRLGAGIAAGDWKWVKSVGQAAPEGEPDRAWRETVLMAHLFCGFPKAIEAFDTLAKIGGVGAPGPDECLGWADQPEAGDRVFDQVYGERADEVRGHLAGYHPDFAGWIRGHAYGRVLSRPGLSVLEREVIAVVMLAASGMERQLASHARGAVRCGATQEDVLASLDEAPASVSAQRLDRARNVIRKFAQQRA